MEDEHIEILGTSEHSCFTHCCFTHCCFTRCCFTHCCFTHCCSTHCCFTHCCFTHCCFTHCCSTHSCFAHSCFTHGCFTHGCPLGWTICRMATVFWTETFVVCVCCSSPPMQNGPALVLIAALPFWQKRQQMQVHIARCLHMTLCPILKESLHMFLYIVFNNCTSCCSVSLFCCCVNFHRRPQRTCLLPKPCCVWKDGWYDFQAPGALPMLNISTFVCKAAYIGVLERAVTFSNNLPLPHHEE